MTAADWHEMAKALTHELADALERASAALKQMMDAAEGARGK